MASMAYQKDRDNQLKIIKSDHLFGTNTTKIAIRRGHYLRGFAYKFIELCSANLTQSKIKVALKPIVPLEI